MKLAIAGSRDLEGYVGTAVLSVLHRLLWAHPDGVEVIMRRGVSTAPGPVEQQVYFMTQELERVGMPVHVVWRLPAERGGRASVYARDIEMVADADLVLVFLSRTGAEDGYSGTYHVLEQAIQQDRPVYAWAMDERHGTVGQSPHLLRRFGEWDTEHRYTRIVDG